MAVIRSQFTLRLNEIVFVKIRKIAEHENRSMNNMIETSLKKFITEFEDKNGEIEITEEDLGLE